MCSGRRKECENERRKRENIGFLLFVFVALILKKVEHSLRRMINVNNQNRMQRHEQIIKLSDHVKNKLKQQKYSSMPSPSINSSDEFIEIDSSDEDNGR